MDIKSIKRDGHRQLKISGISSGDILYVVPLLMLQGLSESEATAGYKKVINDGEFILVDETRKISIQCNT